MTERGAKRTVENDGLYAVLPETDGNSGYLHHEGLNGYTEPETSVRSTDEVETMEYEEIAPLLRETGVLEGAA